MVLSLDEYKAGRDTLLRRLDHDLRADERFAAAWLTGSVGRGEEDAVSDLDLSVVVRPTTSNLLERTASIDGPAPARMSLFQQFGRPAIIHENPHNAPSGGTFSVVVYQDGPYFVDWMLIPQSTAVRPEESRLLFDHVGISLAPPTPVGSEIERAAGLAERVAFFWMMAATTVKYLFRGDDAYFIIMMDQLQRIATDIERLVRGEPPRFTRGSAIDLPISLRERQDAVRVLCDRVDALTPRLETMGIEGFPSARSVIGALLALSDSDQQL